MPLLPLNAKLSLLFLLTGWVKALLQDKPARSRRFQGQDTFPVIVSMQKVTEQRWIKTVFSYDLFIIIIFFLQTKFFVRRFCRKWFYEKIFLNPPKIELYPGCVLYLSLLAIKVEIGHCHGKVLRTQLPTPF